MALDASRLTALDRYHERQDDRIQLFRGAVRPEFIDRRIDLILETALGLGQCNHRGLGLLGVTEDAGVNPGKVGEVGEVFDHARGVGAPLTFRSVGFPIKARIAKFAWKLRNVLARLVEAYPDQTVALLHAIGFGAR